MSPRIRTLLLLLTLFVAATPGGASAQEGPTSEARYFPPYPYRPKEFTLVRKDGMFHLFYIRENTLPGSPATQMSFGHATSPDLYFWAEQDTILPVVPGTFEGTQVWAPSVHRIGDTYYMFYVGMRDEPTLGYRIAQSVTCATSTDLWEWTRRDTPLFDNGIFPWAFYDSTQNQGRDCRDPFLWWDQVRGEWLLYVATRPAFQPQSMVIGIAGSTDLTTWSDRGYVPITLPSSTFSDVAESPHIMTRSDSLFLLLFTTNSSQAITFGRSTDPVTGWNTSRRLRNMLGYTTLGWWGSESLEDGERLYFGNILNHWVQFWDMTWVAPDTFQLAYPDSFQVLSTGFDRGHAAPGDSLNLIITSIRGTDRVVHLAYEQTKLGGTIPVEAAALGLPDSVVLTGDTTYVSWVPQQPPDATTYLLRARVPDSQTAVELVRILVPDDNMPTPPPDPDPVITRVLLPRDGRIRFVRERSRSAFTVRVHDLRGRMLWEGEAPAGERVLVWDARDRAGRRVAPGMYFARVTGRDRQTPERLRVPILR